MSASAAAFPAPSAATVSYRRHAGARPGGAAFGRRWNRPAAPAPPGRHRTERVRKTALRENAAVVSGAGSAVPTGDDEPSTFPKPSFRGLHTLARTLGNAEPASTPHSSAPAAASAYGFHFGSFPLEAFPDTIASNVIPLFRARKGGVVARARAADDGADAKKERSGEDVEDASEGDSDSDDDAYDIPGTTRGSSGDSGDPAPGRPKKATGEEDDSERGEKRRKEKERRAFFKSRPELARSVVTFSETAEMLCLLTAGGVRVAQLTQMGRERHLQAAARPKRSVAFVAAAAAPAPAPPSALSLGRVGSVADGALVAAVGVHVMLRRLVGRNNVVPLGNVAPAPAGDDAAQFADVVSRVRARAALLADVKKDLASSRLQAEIAAKAAARAASQGAVTPTQTQTQTEPVAAAASGDASASPSLEAARLEARLAREAAEATARHREVEVSAANARAAAAEEMAQAARARAAEAEAMLSHRDEMDRREEWQTETEVRTINTTRSTRGGSAWNRDRAYGVSDPRVRADRSDASARNRNAAALNPPDFDRSIPVTDLVMDDSRAVSAAVDAETLALREEVERLRRAAAEETEECGFEDGYEGGQPFDECQ